MSEYTIEATVTRSNGSKQIVWEFTGRGCGAQTWNAWRKMRASGETLDTQEPFHSAAVLRDGAVVESIGR